MRTVFVLFGLSFFLALAGQTINAQLNQAMKQLEADPQFSHASVSMYVVNSNTGQVVFDKNSQTGLAPASCQKIVTSAAAFELLGNNFVYTSTVVYDGSVVNGTLNGNLYILPAGDPTTGSWRWKTTTMSSIIENIADKLTAAGINTINGKIFVSTASFASNSTPDGWVWEDIGNYYGAGAFAFNWHENQFDLSLKSGDKMGSKATIIDYELKNVELTSEVTTAAKGTGDNVYIYLPPYANKGFVRGTIPLGSNDFVVKGAIPDPVMQFLETLKVALINKKIAAAAVVVGTTNNAIKTIADLKTLYQFQSPTFDSINYWFLRKSVNLFGEAFVKTIALEKNGFGATDSGIAIIKDFWSRRGIEKSALNIIDGSGLSPANRVTTNALVTILQYAKKQPWFSSFYNALPEMNGIKMKDGYIGGVRSYTGYVKSAGGENYTFAFIVNNFDGNPGTVREKIWKLLNILK